MLHPRVERAGAAEKLPRLKMILRGKAHSVRRLTQRTFKVDPVLNGILDELVTGQKSIAEMLHLSEPCSQVFRAELKRREKPSDAPGATVHDLSWAKHRFDGVAKPLGVCVWNLDAVISTGSIIARGDSFKAEYRKSCRKFLDGLCPEKIILMGMMADASDEVLTLCRFFDREAFETDQMAAQIVAFKARVRLLFREEACLSQGFTRIALRFLEKPRMVRDGAGAMKTVGGPSPDYAAVARACGQRMVAWSDLAEEVANAEFPDFELLGSFQIFRLHFQDVRLKRQRGCLPPEAAEDHPMFEKRLFGTPRWGIRGGPEPAPDRVPGPPCARPGRKAAAPRAVRCCGLAARAREDTSELAFPTEVACKGFASNLAAFLLMPWLYRWD